MSMGLVITPDFVPTKEDDIEMSPPYYRSILYNLDDISRALLPLGRPLILTVNNQCTEVRGDWSGWDNAIFQICEKFKSNPRRLLLIEAGNELDLYWDTNNNDVPPEFGADIARRAARIAHNYGIKVSATSVASKSWEHYLTIMADLCRQDVDFFNIHPYGQRPNGWKDGQQWMHGNLEDVIRRVQHIGQKDVVCTEYGVKIRDAGNEVEVGNFLVAADETLTSLGVKYAAWFAYVDMVGTPAEQGLDAFGLISASNRKRQAYWDFVALNFGEPPVEEDWSNRVGKGLLDMMKADNTSPAMASEWRPFDRPPGTPATIEMCIGLNNVTYCWNLKTSSGWRIRPS